MIIFELPFSVKFLLYAYLKYLAPIGHVRIIKHISRKFVYKSWQNPDYSHHSYLVSIGIRIFPGIGCLLKFNWKKPVYSSLDDVSIVNQIMPYLT